MMHVCRYGDIIPHTIDQRLITCVFLLLGVAVTGNLLGIISSMSLEAKQQQEHEKEVLLRMNSGEGEGEGSNCPSEQQLTGMLLFLYDSTGWL